MSKWFLSPFFPRIQAKPLASPPSGHRVHNEWVDLAIGGGDLVLKAGFRSRLFAADPNKDALFLNRPSPEPTLKEPRADLTPFSVDMHLRLAIRNGGNELRDKLRALL